MLRKLSWVVAGLLVLLAIAAGGGALWLRAGGRPQRAGEQPLAGLEARVRVRFDAWGVPHVEAENERDLAVALGYLHANDRMTQMELGRRAVAGRLSEMLGEAAFGVDVYFRTLRTDRVLDAMETALGERSRRWLAGYADGVNAWLAARGGDLPPGLRLLGVRPEPWRPRDSLAFAVLMARDLSFWNERPEEARFQWLRAFGAARAGELIAAQPPHVPAATAGLAAAAGADLAPSSASGPRTLASPGSNNWALAPSRTAAGGALIANDPHLGLHLPSVWYQVHLRAPGYQAAGMTLPGAPGVVLGRGAHVAWAFTNTMLDDHDLFFEQLDDTGTRVRRGAGWQPVAEERQVVRLRGGERREIVLRATDHGPLLDADREAGLPARSLAWTAYQGGDTLAPFFALAGAAGVDQVLAALDGFVCPAQNLVAALDDGTLLFTVIGRLPARRTGDGRLPSPGWDPAYGWDGVLPRAANPLVVLPAGSAAADAAGSVLVTANHDIRPAGYRGPLSADFFEPHRAERIRERLLARDDWDVETTMALQTDVVSRYARAVVAHLDTLALDGEAASARAAFEGWDGAMAGSGPAALYGLFQHHLMAAVFDDEAAAAAVPPIGTRDALLRLLDGEIDPVWFDDVSTPAVEDRTATIARGLATAWRDGQNRWGDDLGAWAYGALHTLELRHRLDPVPGLGRWLRRGPFPADGSATTVAAYGAAWRRDALTVTYGPSMRWIVDWGRPDRAWAGLPGGQSGHGADPHYDDQLEDFLAGRLHPAPWTETAIEAATVSELRLVPGT